MADDNNKTNSSPEYPKSQEELEKGKDLPEKIADKMKEEAKSGAKNIEVGDEVIEKMTQEGTDFIKLEDKEKIGAEREKIKIEAGDRVKEFENIAEGVMDEKPENKNAEKEKIILKKINDLLTFNFTDSVFAEDKLRELENLVNQAENDGIDLANSSGIYEFKRRMEEAREKVKEAKANVENRIKANELKLEEYRTVINGEGENLEVSFSKFEKDIKEMGMEKLETELEKLYESKEKVEELLKKIQAKKRVDKYWDAYSSIYNISEFDKKYNKIIDKKEKTAEKREKLESLENEILAIETEILKRNKDRELKSKEKRAKTASATEGEEKKTTLTEKEQLTIDNIEKILEEEKEFKKQYEKEGSSVAGIYGPAVEAIRSFCGTDKEVSMYMDLLIETIKQKLENGEAEYMGEAVDKTYKELDGDKKRSFEEASKNEVKRQKSKFKDEMGITVETPPERLFREFVMKLLEKMPLEKKEKEIKPNLENSAENKTADTTQEQQISPEEPEKEMTEEEREIKNIIEKVENEGKISQEEGEFILKKIQEKESEFYKGTSKEEREKLGKEFLKYEELDDEEKKRREFEIEEAKKKLAEDEKVAVENEEEIERKISELEKELKEKFENYAKMDEELKAIYESEDTAGRKELGPVSDQLKEIWKYKLKLEKLHYLRQSLTDKKAGSIEEQIKDPEALLNSCDRRKSGIEHWEKVIAMLDKDFEEMSEEEKSFFEKLLAWVKHNPKKTVLIATLIAAGVLVAPYAAPYISAENVGKVAIAGGVIVGGKMLYEKFKPQLKKLAEIGGTAAVVGLLLLNDNWGSIDDFAEWACGMKIPNWAKRFEDKSKK